MIAPVLDKFAGEADSSKIEFYKVDVDEASEISHKAGVTAVCNLFVLNTVTSFANCTSQRPDADVPGVQHQEPQPGERLCRGEGSCPSKATGAY
jgi:hypothetical protein